MSSSRDADLKRLIEYNRFLSGQSTHWCPIVSSKKVKKELINRINAIGVSVYEICARADVSYNTVDKYYLKEEEPLSRPSLRAEDLMKMAELVGIEIRTAICIVKKLEDIDRDKLLNDKFIPRGKRKKNKKLDGNGRYIGREAK